MKSEQINDRVSRAKADPGERDYFLQEEKSFILKSAGKALNRYITDSDDEWSVALSAFSEAIDSYEEGMGSGFYGFAQLVIKRRLLNYVRSQQKYRPETMTEPAVLEGNLDREDEVTSYQMEVRDAVAEASKADRHTRLSEEIDALERDLEWYPIDFFDLEGVSPKAGKTKDACGVLIARLWRNPDLFRKMRESKSLPLKELLAGTGIHKKIPERHRKYIIAAAEILHGDYPILQEYLASVKQSENRVSEEQAQ